MAEGCGGHAHETDATVGGGRSETNRIEERAAADGEDVGVTADLVGLDGGERRLDHGRILLGRFAPGQHQRRPGELHTHGLTISGDLCDEARAGGRQTRIDNRDDLSASKEVGQDAVARRERMLRKEDAVAVGYREFEVKGVVHSPRGGVIRALTTPAGKPCSLPPAVNFRQKALSLRNPATEQQRQAKADERAEDGQPQHRIPVRYRR